MRPHRSLVGPYQKAVNYKQRLLTAGIWLQERSRVHYLASFTIATNFTIALREAFCPFGLFRNIQPDHIAMAAAQQMATMPVSISTVSPAEKAESIPDEIKTSNESADDAGESGRPTRFLTGKVPFYRTVFFNLCVVGMCAFLCPGIFNASKLPYCFLNT
jgi:hypothetical protein